MKNEVIISINERREELNTLIKFLENMDSNNEVYASYTAMMPILKASVFMLLYNLIESTMYLLYEYLFYKIITHRMVLSELTDSIKKQYLKYYIEDDCDYENKLVDLEFQEYVNRVKVFSGNLDARAIRELLEEWGIERCFHVKGEENLLVIKNYRNILAHGDRSYKEVGRNYTISEIKKISTYTDEYLSELLKIFMNYVEYERYICKAQ